MEVALLRSLHLIGAVVIGCHEGVRAQLENAKSVQRLDVIGNFLLGEIFMA